MEEVTITLKLLLQDEQSSCGWIYESIYDQLDHNDGEAILEYCEDHPDLSVGMTD